VRAEAEAVTSGLLEPMRKAAEMVERHLEGIPGHWKQGLTTAFLEGLNSLFSATKRKARGYRSIPNSHALLRGGQTGDPVLLTHYKRRRSFFL
jgi:transposase